MVCPFARSGPAGQSGAGIEAQGSKSIIGTNNYELSNMKYAPFEPGGRPVCSGAGMERWTGTSVLRVAQYPSSCSVTSFLASSGHFPILVARVCQEERKAVSVDRHL